VGVVGCGNLGGAMWVLWVVVRWVALAVSLAWVVNMQGKGVGEVEGKALKCPLLGCDSMI
jgi:hypothetical protein